MIMIGLGSFVLSYRTQSRYIIPYCTSTSATWNCIKTIRPSICPSIHTSNQAKPTLNKTKQNKPQTKMTESQNIQDLRRANAEYVKNFPPEHASLPVPPSNRLLIVTCMDARFHPPSALGLTLGSTHLVRNAGGSAEGALPSIIVSQQKLNTDELLLIKHTDCGMYPGQDSDKLAEAVVRDVNFLKNHGDVKGSISGWLYDVKTGGVTRIV